MERDSVSLEKKDKDSHDRIVAVFAFDDKFSILKPVFDEDFVSDFGPNSSMIFGIHEVTMHPDQLDEALFTAFKLYKNACGKAYVKNVLPKIYGN